MRPTRHRYGQLRYQVGDLWIPADAKAGLTPLVVLIHGGYWRSIYTKSLMNPLARAVVARGWAAWNIEYRRMGALGGGGGWPATLVDVDAAVEHVSQFVGIDLERVVTAGHSVGGCLALWVAARNRIVPHGDGRARQVQPLAAMSLAGVVDLERGAELGLGGGAVQQFLGGTFEEHPERYASSSPMALVPLGIPQVLLHGLSDDVVPASMSRDYQRRADAAGDETAYVPLEGLGHRDVIDPKQRSWPVIGDHLDRLLSL